MNAKDISSRKFDRAAFNGYKPDDVDNFLREVSSQFAQLQKDNRDLEKKLEVLADKVREYRDDEDALKEALLGAQKQGNAAISEAKAKAKTIIEEAQDKADSTLADARAASDKLKKEADDNLKNANDEARRIHEESTAKQAKMEEDYRSRLGVNKEILYKTKNEVARFRQKIMEDFARVEKIIEALPESCESEFVAKTLTEYQKERNVTLKKPIVKPAPELDKTRVVPAPVQKTDKKEGGDSDALYEEFANQMLDEKESTSFEVKLEEKILTDLTTEINFEPVFDEEEEDDTSESDMGAVNDEEADDAAAEDLKQEDGEDNPFFSKGQKSAKEREPLEFGGNAKNGRKK